MTRLTRRRLIELAGAGAGAAGAAAFLAGHALAQSWPARPVRVIVPFPPGGITDVLARLVTGKIAEQLGRQFYVENVVGGSGNIGMGQAARAPADGYTILTAFSSFVINPSLFQRIPFDPVKDFEPVSLAVTSTSLFAVHPSVKAATLDELAALIRANPGKFSYASAGTGTTSHLAGEQFRLAFGLDLVHVPFGGGAPAMAAVVAGHTPMGVGTPIVAAPLMRDGQIRALAVTSRTRTQSMPEVPTMAEGGHAEIAGDNFVGFVVPAGTPKEIVDLLSHEIARALAAPDMRERLAMLGYDPIASAPAEFGNRIKSELVTWAKVVKAANIPTQ